ncbi:MAG TPA: efflux transporter outer membrane subunit [Steroidobacteraceae bacterium]|jgi:NodT family efflux transporter outer membrane factor (OMF) lipoprotein|nr:efflux transporter outer membrane subunit [Steroidobacteraceae bacterium]
MYPRILILTCAALICGCSVGPRFTRPVPPAATRYIGDTATAGSAQGDATAQHIELGQQIEGDWWNLFRSDPINGIVTEALAHNRTLAASAATLAQAQELAAAQAGVRYPQVGLTAGVGRQKYGDEFLGGFFNLPPFTYYAVGPTVSYTLDYTGGVARSIEQQYALAQVREHQLEAAYLTVSGQAVMQALAIASIRAQIGTVETILEQDQDNLKLVQTAFNDGSVARIDVVSAQSQIANDMALLPPLRQELAKAHHALAVVLGQPPANDLPADVDLKDVTLPTELPVSLPSELAHRRPDILAAEAQLHAATSAVGVADSNLYPKIQLTGTLGQQAVKAGQLFDSADTAWSLVSGLTAPLFDGGTLRAQKRAAIDAMHATAATYQETVLEAFAQVADTLEALNHDAEQLDAQDKAQQAAQSGLDLARASYAEGNTGVLQVLDAERSYQQARLGYVRAVAQRYLDTVQLFLALGGGSPCVSYTHGCTDGNRAKGRPN